MNLILLALCWPLYAIAMPSVEEPPDIETKDDICMLNQVLLAGCSASNEWCTLPFVVSRVIQSRTPRANMSGMLRVDRCWSCKTLKTQDLCGQTKTCEAQDLCFDAQLLFLSLSFSWLRTQSEKKIEDLKRTTVTLELYYACKAKFAKGKTCALPLYAFMRRWTHPLPVVWRRASERAFFK